MRHPRPSRPTPSRPAARRAPLAGLAALAPLAGLAALAPLAGLAALATLAGCGGCEEGDGEFNAEEQVEEVRSEEVASGEVPPPDTRLPSATGETPGACLAFCEKSLECAEAGGYPIPEGARDCDRSCAPDGVHRTAPPSVWDCADRPCGTAFQSCSVQAMMEHQRGSEIGAFPMTCEGLCNKAAWCAERTGAEPGPGEEDCRTACRPGGAYAEVAPNEFRCVEAACGGAFQGCRAAGGPTSP